MEQIFGGRKALSECKIEVKTKIVNYFDAFVFLFSLEFVVQPMLRNRVSSDFIPP